MMTELWLVGQYKSGQFPSIVWEFVGVFTTEDAALRACPDIDYFMTPVKVNEAAQPESGQFPYVWYPQSEHRPTWANG
jgi:hypothetical protein